MSIINQILDWLMSVWNTHGDKFLSWLGDTGMSMLKTVLILVVGFWIAAIVARAVKGALYRSKVDKAVGNFIVSCVRVGLKGIVIIMAIAALGLNITSIITALGAAGITVGLAMQDSLANFASGVLILFNKPFKAGDFIELEDSSGTVTDISLMYTTLVNTENKEVIYPNSSVIANKIINHTALDERRIEFKFAVAADSSVVETKAALLAAAEKSEFVIKGQDFEPMIGIAEFGGGRILYDLRLWIRTSDYRAAYYEIEERVYDELKARNIALAHDQVDVHLRQN